MLKRFLYPGADSNCHAHKAPPPQDGASTNFATRVYAAKIQE